MAIVTTVGVDLAKKVFQVHGVDAAGKVVFARQLRRKDLLAFFGKLPTCLVGMEACGSAHHWARELAGLGHDVKLMPPKYVKPYVKRGKTDAGDAEAICEAVTRPTMDFVPVKSLEAQGLAILHGTRTLLVSQRTQGINALRGHLSELGIIAEKGFIGLAELAAIVRDASDDRLPVLARHALIRLVQQIEATSAEISALDATIRTENKASDVGRRLLTIPSVGPIVASALRARVVDPGLFENGRHLSAWIGIVPENDSTGGRIRQKGLSKKGDRYLRAMLVSGGMAIVQHARRRPDKYPWVAKLLERMSMIQAAIAVANRTARIAWAIMTRGGVYEAGHRAPSYRGEAVAAAT